MVVFLLLLLAGIAHAGPLDARMENPFITREQTPEAFVTGYSPCDRACSEANGSFWQFGGLPGQNTGWTQEGVAPSFCGDGQVDAERSEECDPAQAVSSCVTPSTCVAAGPSACTCTAQTNVCGDGSIASPEVCDCGGSSTSCSAPVGQCSGLTSPTCESCQCVAGNVSTPECGNGTLEAPEICDPGGKTCSTNADCGQSGICSTTCAAANGGCTAGCSPDCTQCLAVTGCPVGTDRWVRTDGSDSNDGSADLADAGGTGQAWRTIAFAAANAMVGEIVCIRAGTYRETNVRMTFTSPVNESERITFAGESDANGNKLTIFNAQRDAGGSGWVLDTSFGCSNCYRRTLTYSASPGVPEHGTFNGGYVVRYDGDGSTADWQATLTNGPNDTASCCCCSTNKSRSFRAADVIYAIAGGDTFIRFSDNRNPNNVASGDLGFTAKEPAMDFNGRDFVTIQNIDFRNSYAGVQFSDGSNDDIVQDCRFQNHYHGVRIVDSVARPIIRRNTFTLNYHKSFTGTNGTGINDFDGASSGPTLTHRGSDPDHWRLWQLMKDGYDSDPTGISSPAGTITGPMVVNDNTATNHYQLFNQDNAVIDCPAATTVCADIYNNVAQNLMDDGLDWQRSTVRGLQVRDNRIFDANVGLRIGVLTGPAYFYRNQVYAPESGGTLAEAGGIYMFRGTSGSQYIYHNSFLTKVGIYFATTSFTTGLANTRIYNNAISGGAAHTSFVTYTNAFDSSACGCATCPCPRPTLDYNWSTDGLPSWNASAGSNIRSQNRSIWTPNTIPTFEPPITTGATELRGNGDYVLSTGSPTTQPWLYVADNRPYVNPPDIGALQYVVLGATTTSTSTTSSAPGATTTSTTLNTDGSAAVDWSNSFCGLRMEEASPPGTRAAFGTCASESPSCQFTEEVGIDVPQDTTNFYEGSASANIDTDADRLVNSPKCASFGTNSTGDETWLFWARPTQGAGTTRVIWRQSDNSVNGFRHSFSATDTLECVIGDGTDRVTCSKGTSPSNGTWLHYACAFNDTADTIALFANGSSAGTTCTQQALAAGTGTNQLGQNDNTNFVGNLDEVLRYNGVLSSTNICRIAACGADGSRCTCAASGTAYKACSTDADCRNCSGCSSTAICTASTCRGRSEASACTLPNCNTAAP